MSTENEGRKAREFWLLSVTEECCYGSRIEGKIGWHAYTDTPLLKGAIHVREVLPGEPAAQAAVSELRGAGSARTFEEWWRKLPDLYDVGNQEMERCYGGLGDDRDVITYCSAARAVWNAAREGMVPAGTAAPAQEWVSVEERLPDCDIKVLAAHCDGSVGSYRRAEGEPMMSSVTHWMPLPPPPAKPLTPFEQWWLSLPTHENATPETFRLVAGACVHVSVARRVWEECEGVRGGGK